MEEIKNDIAVLKEEMAKLVLEKDSDMIRHFNEVYGADFGDSRAFNDFFDLWCEDEEGYFDPFDLVMDENDIIHFMKWRYRLYLIANMQSISESVEKIERGDSHTAVKALEKDISDLRKYKNIIRQMIEASNIALDKADELIKIADKYRK